MNNQKNGGSKYSVSFRHRVAQDYLSGDLTHRQIQAKYDLPTIHLSKWWVRKYRKNPDLGALPLPPMTDDEKREKEALEKRIKALEKQLEDERLRSLSLDTLIDVAEDMFDIDIRKKPGTKQ